MKEKIRNVLAFSPWLIVIVMIGIGFILTTPADVLIEVKHLKARIEQLEMERIERVKDARIDRLEQAADELANFLKEKQGFESSLDKK